MTQLDLFRRAGRKPHPTGKDTLVFIEYLHTARDWRTRAQVKEDTGISEGKLRIIRNANQCKIICGKNGYKHMDHVTRDELTSAIAFFTGQANEMNRKAQEYIRVGNEQGIL